jgi:hypothetical protein
MKSEVVDGRFYIECACGSPHHLIFEIYKEDKTMDIDVYFASAGSFSFWDRFKQCFWYLINKEKYLSGDGVIIDKKNIKQLQEVINYIKAGK